MFHFEMLFISFNSLLLLKYIEHFSCYTQAEFEMDLEIGSAPQGPGFEMDIDTGINIFCQYFNKDKHVNCQNINCITGKSCKE